jgi:isopenicillin-N epimerase
VYQRRLQERLEAEPVRFFRSEYEGLLDEARASLARFLGAKPADVAFVTNATTGVNTVLRSLTFRSGDELLVTDHAYNACRNALDYAAERSGARVVVVEIPFPIASADEVIGRVIAKVGSRTRLALLDHVTSSTGLVLPIETLVRELNARGVETLVDGAHAPGMLPLNIPSLGAAYYTGNCHKWLCAPKGSAFLWVRPDRQKEIRPLVISHGANSPRTDRSRFQLEFDWVGTQDPTAWLSVPEALRFMASLVPDGWLGIMRRNRALALAAREELCGTFGIPAPVPESMIASLAALPLPAGGEERLEEKLLKRYGIEAAVFTWPRAPKRLLRVAAQVYNGIDQYKRLATALRELFRP